MRRKHISFTKSCLYGFEAVLIVSFSYAYFELKQNFPDRLDGSILQNARATIDYWFGWLLVYIWLYIIGFTLVLGAIIHGIRHFWRHVFGPFK